VQTVTAELLVIQCYCYFTIQLLSLIGVNVVFQDEVLKPCNFNRRST